MPKIPQVVKPIYDNPRWETTDEETCRFWLGDVRKVLDRIPSGVVQCVVTSPPYWGLRDYGQDKTEEIGSEPTPQEFVATMVGVFRKLKIILRHDGVVFLNLGDTYNSGGENRQGKSSKTLDRESNNTPAVRGALHGNARPTMDSVPKGSLLGIPWRVALALQEDGWILRSDMPWVKRNAMPESVTNRPAKALEYVFMLAKSQEYFYDQEAVRQIAAESSFERDKYDRGGTKSEEFHKTKHGQTRVVGFRTTNESGRNFRNSDLWFQSIKEPHGLVGVEEELVGLDVVAQSGGVHHFATFPPKLITPLILAGTSEYGCCANCRSPYVRIKSQPTGGAIGQSWHNHEHDEVKGNMKTVSSQGYLPGETIGWECYCNCDTDEVIPCTVFDPFMGSGTTALVSLRNNRYCWGVELSESYLMGMAVNQVIGEIESIPNNKWLVP